MTDRNSSLSPMNEAVVYHIASILLASVDPVMGFNLANAHEEFSNIAQFADEDDRQDAIKMLEKLLPTLIEKLKSSQ